MKKNYKEPKADFICTQLKCYCDTAVTTSLPDDPMNIGYKGGTATDDLDED